MLNNEKSVAIREMVVIALSDNSTNNLDLAKIFADSNDLDVIIDTLVDSVSTVKNFDGNFTQHLLERLSDGDYDVLKPYDYFEDVAQAELEGYYWFEELDLWVRSLR